MKRLLFVAVIVVIAVVLGCGGGGGGGGGGNGNTGTTGTITNISMQAVWAGTQATLNMADLATGNKLTLEMVGFNSAGNYVVLSGATFSTIAPSNVATLSGATLRITGSSNGTSYTITGVYQGTTYNLSFDSVGQMAQVYGTVRDINNVNIAGAEVEFFDSAGTNVGEVTSGFSGQFVANVPTSAVGFTVDLSSLSATYFNDYLYNGLGYTISVGNCHTSLQKLTLNKVTSLPFPIVAVPISSGAPPPPDGC